MQCIVKTEDDRTRAMAKMELAATVSNLMPEGRPAFSDVIKFPMIRDLIKSEGRAYMMKIVFLMVADFCRSVNVVRNMNEDQMIEVAAMLLDECDNFRTEDYLMFFTMAKRGQLGRILDRIDIQLISTMLDEYWLRRHNAGERERKEEDRHYNSLGDTTRYIETLDGIDKRGVETMTRLGSTFERLRVMGQIMGVEKEARSE